MIFKNWKYYKYIIVDQYNEYAMSGRVSLETTSMQNCKWNAINVIYTKGLTFNNNRTKLFVQMNIAL